MGFRALRAVGVLITSRSSIAHGPCSLNQPQKARTNKNNINNTMNPIQSKSAYSRFANTVV